jgi:hypothetical protein
MSALCMSAESLARETGLSATTVRYFGRAPASLGTLTVLNSALGFPPGYLVRLLAGEPPGPAGTPGPPESPVMARLTRIGQKLDGLLARGTGPHAREPYP